MYLWEHKLIETIFKTQLQPISSRTEAQHKGVTISPLILERLENNIQFYSKYAGLKYWGLK